MLLRGMPPEGSGKGVIHGRPGARGRALIWLAAEIWLGLVAGHDEMDGNIMYH